MKISRSRIIILSVIFIGSVLFLFVFAKSYVSSFTHDESISYLNYCHESFMDIISFSNWYTNNHVLNSLFMKYSEQLFGNSEIALRLPNLLMLIIYMVYSYLLFKNTNSFLSLAMFTLMCTNPLLMDLFGLARGYGMSCGFMVMSIYHFIEFFRDHKITNLALFHTAALLACLSNFTLLTYYAAIMLVYNPVAFLSSKFIMNENFRFFKSNKIHIIPLLLVITVLFEPVRRALSYGTFDFGGKNGFYQDTMLHLILNAFHGMSFPPFAMMVLQIIITCLVFISLVIIVLNIINRSQGFFEQYLGFVISCFLFITISLIIILLHAMIGTDYPISRFSIFLFPVFMVHMGFLLDYLMSIHYHKLILTFISGIALVSLISFWQKANLYSSLEWAYDMKTKNMIQALALHHQKNNPCSEHIKLGINWLFEPTINFYRETKGMDWLLQVDRNGMSENDDYYYLFKDDLNQLDSIEYEVIEKYENINTLLLLNKHLSK
jgi:hypothetical protein